jgi:hypothetical protein
MSRSFSHLTPCASMACSGITLPLPINSFAFLSIQPSIYLKTCPYLFLVERRSLTDRPPDVSCCMTPPDLPHSYATSRARGSKLEAGLVYALAHYSAIKYDMFIVNIFNFISSFRILTCCKTNSNLWHQTTKLTVQILRRKGTHVCYRPNRVSSICVRYKVYKQKRYTIIYLFKYLFI